MSVQGKWIHVQECAFGGCLQLRRTDKGIEMQNSETPDVVIEFSQSEWKALQEFDLSKLNT